jgi:pantothenate synthetase
MAPKAKKAKTEPALPVFTTADEMRAWSRAQRKKGKRIAFVPTMVSSQAHCLLCR